MRLGEDMTDHNQLDAIEQRLLDLEEAERADVFSRTPVDSEQLLQEPAVTASRTFGLAQRLAPLVAAVAIVAVAVCGWVFGPESVTIPEPDRFAGTAPSVDTAQAVTLQECMNGPVGSLLPGCDEFDLDDDGSVTLADFGAYQLAYADVTR
jgi:hypothetical protein